MNRKRTEWTACFVGLLLGVSLAGGTACAADPASFADGFEGSSVDGFWTRTEINGTITLTSAQVHSGAQAAQFTATGSGQKTVTLSHLFSQPQYGKVSVWFYDPGDYIYFLLGMENTALGRTAGLGVQDWDGSAYYYGANGSGGISTVPRTRAWHQFSLQFTVSGLALSIDGQVVYNGAGGTPFDKVSLMLSGPGDGGVLYDDFLFEAAAEPAPIQITSLSSAGQLAWTNAAALTNGLFAIEWAAAPGTNWHSSWRQLQAFPIWGQSNAVEVPMLYRVKCVTNLFVPLPIGGQLSFSVSNVVGNTWTEQMTCLNLVRPSAGGGKEYGLMENIEAGRMKLHLLRSTDAEVYRFDGNTLAETLEFRIGPVGTTWTNYNYQGEWTLKVSVEAIETVTVAGGTFANCYKFHKQALNAPGSDRADWYEWLKPGVGMVKWVDYWVDASENPPIVHELQSRGLAMP